MKLIIERMIMVFKNFATVLLLLISLIGCSFNKPTSKQTSKNLNKSLSISEELRDWNSQQKITLLEHQLMPIDYLEKNPDVGGLVVDHYLGTGKTFLALGLAERHPSKKIVLLVPRFLRSHWQKNMEIYGVKDVKRYNIVSHSDPEILINSDLTNTIVIIDESHRLINQLNSYDPTISALYSKLYLKIRSANKILSLTGTPIYADISDIAYQLNLVAKEELIPFNRSEFRKQFTKIDQNKAFIRGHLAESQMISPSLVITGSFAAATLGASIPVTMATSVAGLLTPYFIKSSWPINDYSLRSVKIDEMKNISTKYITYYDFSKMNFDDYPSKNISYKDVDYNSLQLDFLMRFADARLTTEEIVMLQKDEPVQQTVDYIQLNNSKIQETIKTKTGNGREIGNFIYKKAGEENGFIYPSKFAQALKLMNETTRPIVVYSHFYHNGILLFKQYLDAKGYSNYAILDPDLSSGDFEKIITNYNNGNIKFLLIHPEITEGVSLKGTGQMHILEPSFNKSAQDQIIGRVVRYKSHSHLPKDERNVNVYIWKQSISGSDSNHMIALRENWHNNFSELNYYTERKSIDKNADLKLKSADDRSYDSMNFLDQGGDSLKKLLKTNSLEVKYNNEKK